MVDHVDLERFLAPTNLIPDERAAQAGVASPVF